MEEVGGNHGRLIRYMYSIRVKERNTAPNCWLTYFIRKKKKNKQESDISAENETDQLDIIYITRIW